MKLINGQLKSSWKTVLSLIFFTFFLSACKETNETNAGLCNGNWGMVGAYMCDWLPIGNPVFCVFFGKDNDRNGVYQSGTSDQCIVDGNEDMAPIDCNKMCSMNNNCSKVDCGSKERVDELEKRLKTKRLFPASDPLKSS
ncbi:hypothetical protein ACYZUD_27970 [Pseudomonas sp. XS1P51]